jgi:hypothetical protein
VRFNGLIQHSFALQLAKEHLPFDRTGNFERIQERFALPAREGAAFDVRPVCDPADQDGTKADRDDARIAKHSPLVEHGYTTVQPQPIRLVRTGNGTSAPTLPSAFQWAEKSKGEPNPRQNEPKFIFAEVNPATGTVECNDFLVEKRGSAPRQGQIPSCLLEIVAHKRSRLLGLALANRVVSVMLPHAVLTPGDFPLDDTDAALEGGWFAQPLVSFVRGGQGKSEFRDSYALTLFLIPVRGEKHKQRKMTLEEIASTVNAGWGLAAAPRDSNLPQFRMHGPLLEYLSRLIAPCDPASLLRSPGSRPKARVCENALTLRQATEIFAFSLGLRLAQGSRGRATEQTRRRIGDDVVTSLGSARVSSVLVVGNFEKEKIRQGRGRTAPKRHRELMETLSPNTRPPAWKTEQWNYRLDRAFVDDHTYVMGVVPTKHCLVVSSAIDAQHGWRESGLMQIGSVTHMAIGAATATGTLRAIDRRLEALGAADPSKIAGIDGEIATDLREIYDLDITNEAYRNLYRLLRKKLGITRDYEALRDKMTALYRSTSTKHEVRSQSQLTVLTAAIVVLSILILIAGVIAASK